MRIRNDMAWLISTPIAHRGLHGLDSGVPENSLAAFDAAASKGYPMELDVQLSRDGQVVVLHDTNLERMTGMNAAVRDTDYSAMSKLRLRDSDQHIPTLAEVLDLVSARVPIMVEVKSTGTVGELEQSVSSILSSSKQEAAIVSFNPLSLKYFRNKAPQLPRGQNSGLFVKSDVDEVNLNLATRIALQYMLLNSLSRPDFVSYQLEGASTLPVILRRKLGMPVLTWTAKSPDDEATARKYADNIIFENFIPAGRK
jgi:glycerophosphoryl diester phosphodiesterase